MAVPGDTATDRPETAEVTPAAVTAAAPDERPGWREIVAGRERLTAGLVLIELVAGLQSLIVAAVMPRVLADLGGIAFYGAVFWAYMLSGLVSIPRAGEEADHRGTGTPFLRSGAWYAAGSLLCAFAPSMSLLAAARLIAGYGGGALYTLGYGAVTRAYPPRARPRMLALLTAVWIVSGVVGPAYGAVVASHLGWRWAFGSLVPLLVLAVVLTYPAMRRLEGGGGGVRRPLRWPLQLTAGCGVFLGGALTLGWWSAPLVVGGAAVAAAAGRHVLPRGTFRVAPGLAAAVAASALFNIAYFTAESFLPLLLTRVRGQSVTAAGVVLTLSALSWCLASFWQARAVERMPAQRLVAGGGVACVAGIAAVAACLFGAVPVAIAYLGWTVAGAGMGVVYPTVMLAAMHDTGSGGENRALAARFVGGRLGIVLGTGVAGMMVAIAAAVGSAVTTALTGVLVLALVSAVAATATAPRIGSVGAT